jgi:hypothetical protein
MKEISKDLLSFLMNNRSIKINPVQFNTNSKNFLRTLFSLFMRARELFHDTKITKKITEEMEQPDSYIPEGIRNVIMKDKDTIEYSFVINDRNFKISLFHFRHLSESLIKHRILRIFMWLYVASHFSEKKCSQYMHVKIYFTDVKKKLPQKKLSPIESIHANTAFTTSCKKETDINIFREEEWLKVLIHETFHSMGLDFSEMDNKEIDSYIKKLFPVESDVRLFETYCETWAETMNVMFIVFFSTRKNSIEKMIEKTETLLQYEKMFSLFQLVKVLRHFNLTYDQIIENDKTAIIYYKEKTQVLSYYILKCIYLFNIEEFMQWCLSHNGETLNFNKTRGHYKKTLNEYARFVGANYKRPELINALHIMENVQPSKNAEIKNTLRMSLFEIM